MGSAFFRFGGAREELIDAPSYEAELFLCSHTFRCNTSTDGACRPSTQAKAYAAQVVDGTMHLEYALVCDGQKADNKMVAA